MRTGLFIIPFIALLVIAISSAIASAYSKLNWMTYSGLFVAALLMLLWVLLDLEGFKAVFLKRGVKKFGLTSGLIVILGVLITIGVAILSTKARFNKSIDLTKFKTNTLSEQSIKIIHNLKSKQEKLKIIAFFSSEQEKTKFKDLLSLYQRVSDVFDVEWLNPQKEPIRATQEKLTSQDTVIIKFKNNSSRITNFDEEKFTNALIKVLKDESKKIYFLSGHGEPALKGEEYDSYLVSVQELENNNYVVNTLSLLDTPSVPDDASLVIIASPKYDFKPGEIKALEEYIKKGKPLILMIPALVDLKNLFSFLSNYGIKVNDDIIMFHSSDIRAQFYGQNNAIASDFDAYHIITKDFGSKSNVQLLFPNSRSLDVIEKDKVKTQVLSKSSSTNVRIHGVKNISDLKNFKKEQLTTGNSYPLIILSNIELPKKVESSTESNSSDKNSSSDTNIKSQILVFASSAFASNLGVKQQENLDLFVNSVNYLMSDEDFISIRPKKSEKSTINLKSHTSQLLLLVLAFIYPFVFLGSGVIYWLKRKKS